MSPRVLFLTVFVLMIWGIGTGVAKFAVLETSSLIFLGIRSLLAVCVFLPFAHVRKKDLKVLCILGVSMYVLHMGFLSASLRYLPVSSAVVIQQIQVPIAFLLAVLFLKEKITLWQIVGVVIAFLGVCVILGMPEINWVGAVYMILGALFWAVSQIYMKKAKDVEPLSLVAYMSLFSLPFLTVGAFVLDDNVVQKIGQADILKFWGSIVFQLIFVNLALVLWQRLVAENGVGKMSPFMLLQVVFSGVAGVIMFGEVLTFQMLCGALLAVIGVYLTTRKRKALPEDIQ